MAASAARAADRLRERIAAGDLRAGSHLGEQQLAAELGVSRNTLREAFSQLSAEGLIDRQANRGVRVSTLDAERIAELYRVRRMIEPAALLWGTIDETTLTSLHTALLRARRAQAASDGIGMAAANQEFHRTLALASGSATLGTVVSEMLTLMRLAFSQVPDFLVFHAPYIDDNAAVLARLDADDRRGAVDVLLAMLRRSERDLLTRLDA